MEVVYGITTLNLVFVQIILSTLMDLVALLKSLAQMEKYGIQSSMLVNAHQEPIII